MTLKIRIRNAQMNALQFRFTLFPLKICSEAVSPNFLILKKYLNKESSENGSAEKAPRKSRCEITPQNEEKK